MVTISLSPTIIAALGYSGTQVQLRTGEGHSNHTPYSRFDGSSENTMN